MIKIWSLISFWLPPLILVIGSYLYSPDLLQKFISSLFNALSLGDSAKGPHISHQKSLYSSSDIPLCTWENRYSCDGGYHDPNLSPLTFQLSGQEETTTFQAYIDPDVALMYNQTPGTMKPIESNFQGCIAKFINLSPTKVQVYYVYGQNQRNYISDISPFQAAATGSYPSHKFVVVNAETKQDLTTWIVQKGKALYTYDPFDGNTEEATNVLSSSQLELYKLQLDNLKFNSLYEKFTGRSWLGLYKRKYPPRYPIWPADSLGMTRLVTTNETHLKELPPTEILETTVTRYGATLEQRKLLDPYRVNEPMVMPLQVISVIPRVFEIPNFLSQVEVNHIMELATGMTLDASTTGSNAESARKTNDNTRTSRNSWLARRRSVIIDSIYRRAADLLQIDDAYFRFRTDDDEKTLPETDRPIVERLQLVHYAKGEQYTPHHDFIIPDLKDGQPSRFATVLFYLNEGMKGGETSFPRWLNGKTSEILSVKPELGKAILFYNQLPDGNYDERSQHAAKPVIEGEKWLTNLWVWDPYYKGTI